MKEVKDYSIKKDISVKELMEQMYNAGGFTAKKVAEGAEILKNMINDKDCVKFLSFPACIMATGTRGVIRDLIKEKKVDVIMTTCGTLDHDLARLWKDYYHGRFEMNDIELHKKGVHRLGNILVPMESYGQVLEDKMGSIIENIYQKKKEISTSELIWKIGEAIKDEKGAKDTILYWAWKNKVEVFLPGPLDGSIGLQLWMFWQKHKDFRLNLFEDEQKTFDIVMDAKKTGALMIGGGISKHHTIWWNQFREGLDYAIQISTAVEWDGSLSGAKTKEAISWSKIKEKAKHISIEGDATVLLPLMISSIL